MNQALVAVQSCEWLFLRSLDEPLDKALRAVVDEAKAGSPTDPKAVAAAAALPELGAILNGARLIEHSEGCRTFELAWNSYVAYSVRNESYVSLDEYETSEGRLVVKYTKSRFLDYVEKGTFARDDHPGPLMHWGIICANHIIDVVSTEQPTIRLLQGDA